MKALASIALFMAAAFGHVSSLASESRVDAASLRVFERLTGYPITPRDPRHAEIVRLGAEGDRKGIARIATQDRAFIEVVVRTWGSQIVDPEERVDLPLGDALVTLMGSVRDNRDARLLLTGNYVYGADPRLGLGAPSHRNNGLFEALELEQRDLSSLIHFYDRQWEPAAGIADELVAGILTTRQWALVAYPEAATNRAAMLHLMRAFMGSESKDWRDSSAPSYRIRRDIDRAPSGKPEEFQTNCRSCHGVMDALAGAFAYHSLKAGGVFSATSRRIVPGVVRNFSVYPEGFTTRDDSWVNFMDHGKNAGLGWRGPMSGRGIRSLAASIARSEGFSRNLVRRVTEDICGSRLAKDAAFIARKAAELESANYLLKDLFESVATEEACLNGDDWKLKNRSEARVKRVSSCERSG